MTLSMGFEPTFVCKLIPLDRNLVAASGIEPDSHAYEARDFPFVLAASVVNLVPTSRISCLVNNPGIAPGPHSPRECVLLQNLLFVS